MSLYLTAVYMDQKTRDKFEKEYRATGKRLDTGKSCIRFRKLEELPLSLVGKAIASYDINSFIRGVEEKRTSRQEK